MKFKDLNAIITNLDQVQLEDISQTELESEIFRLMKEEKKYSKNKMGLTLKVYQAIEAIDTLKPDFVAEASKTLRALYFKGLAQKEKPAEKKPSLIGHTLKTNNFSQPKFTTIDDINTLLKNILNHEVITIIDGKYLQVQGKNQYKISWLEDEINKQIKQILKEKPRDNNKLMSAVESILYLNKITPTFLHRAGKHTRDNLKKCIRVIHEDQEFVNQIRGLFNNQARQINESLFCEYSLIDLRGIQSMNKNWYLNIATEAYTRPVVEINVDKKNCNGNLWDVMTFNKILNLNLDDYLLKGQGFLPVLDDGTIPTDGDYEAFIRQTININFEIKLRNLATRYQTACKKLDIQEHHSIEEEQNPEKRHEWYKEKEKIEVEFDSLRSVPLSDSCFKSMLAHRNLMAQRLEIGLTEDESNGLTPVYFNKQVMQKTGMVLSPFIPICTSRIKYLVNRINYSIEYTEKRHAIRDYVETKLDLREWLKTMDKNWGNVMDKLDELETDFETHRTMNKYEWAGERHMRYDLFKLIQWCELLNIKIDLQSIDDSKKINLDAELAKALEYPGFATLQSDIESELFDQRTLEDVMNSWPEEWKTQYQQDLTRSGQLGMLKD